MAVSAAAGGAAPGRPTENHSAAAEPGAGDARTLLDVFKLSHLFAAAGAVGKLTSGPFGAAATGSLSSGFEPKPGPEPKPELELEPAKDGAAAMAATAESGTGTAAGSSSALAKDGRQLGMLTGSAAARCRFALDSDGLFSCASTSRFCEPTAEGRVLPLMQTSRM